MFRPSRAIERTRQSAPDDRRSGGLSQDKFSRLKDQLMAVKTNKEYTAMLHEIQIVEEQIRGEEDKILEIMEELETKETISRARNRK